MNRLDGKVAIITGAAVGIGEATARLFAAEGCAVAVVDLDARGAETCAEQLRARGGQACAVIADVSSAESVQQAVEATEREFGGLNIVVNNAGVIGRGTAETTDDKEWHRVLDVNLTGVFRMSRAAIPAIRRRGGGAIVNVSSAAGLAGWYDQAAYDASKGGVVNLTRSMGLDFALEGIRVNCLVPAHVVTPMSETFIAKGGEEAQRARERTLSNIPMGRFSTPEEIAYGALFLASDEASYVTGTTLVVDGGYLAH
jgi:NAD(P)-dependent dehydrogenase (short-subunit alcohol dehydrogenase family)